MAIVTKTITAAALMAAVSMTASAAPAKRVLPEQQEGSRPAMKVIPEHPEEETWKDLGEGVLRDDLYTKFWYVDNVEFPVKIQESEQQPGRYRLVNAWSQYPISVTGGVVYPQERNYGIVVDCTNPDEVFIEPGMIGNYINQLGDEWVTGIISNMMYDYLTDNSNHFTPEDIWHIAGRLRNGAITFPKNSILYQDWTPDMVDENGTPVYYSLWRLVNSAGLMRILLPGAPRVDMEVTLLGLTSDEKSVEYTVTMQQDVAYARAALHPGDDLESIAKGIIDGSIESQELKGDGTYAFPYVGDGIYSLVVVPYTEDGTACYETGCTREFAYDHSEWKPVGTGKYTENILADNEMRKNGLIFNGDTYEVEIEQNTARPLLFRIVNPYKNYYMSNIQTYDSSRNYYMEVDATDPNGVVINKTEDYIGINVGYGDMAIWSRVLYYQEQWGLDPEEAQEWADEFNNYQHVDLYGHLDVDNDVITFPSNSLVLNFPFVKPDTWYWANTNGLAKIELPKGVAAAGVSFTGAEGVAYGPAEYYTIDGVKVDSDNLKPGLYVVRQGGKAWKQVVK